ncbi:MAG: DUF4359 domain-containing protein [Elainella sp. Prado103]|jgi:hypothetical protein|nr:DUF4359 domain-containing protein [Elainella sp. Prado103]
MKSWQVPALLMTVVLAGVGVAMAVTNPDEAAYRDYAAQRLTDYLQEEECTKLDDPLHHLCTLMEGEQGQALMKRLIADNTQRRNYGLFSLYQTNFSTSDVLPDFLSNFLSVPTITYETDTIGVFGNFQTYRAEQQ